jgi:hypothetical protein
MPRLSIALLAIASLAMVACGYFPESSFELASESRLPKWFTLPSGLSRSDVTVTMSCYKNSSGRTVTFTLRDTKNQKIAEVKGTEKGMEPMKLQSQNPELKDRYPSYEIVTVNGITEFIEYRNAEPIFYITDNPAVWAELGRLVF